MDIGPLVGNLPAKGLHLLGPAGENGDLPGFGVQNGVTAEELFAHLFFHEHPVLVELAPHDAFGGDRDKVGLVHHLGDMVGGDGTPMGDAGGAVLVPAGISAVGISLGMADKDGDVCVKDVLVHDDVVPGGGEAQIHQVVVILAVVAGDLAGGVELPEQLLP